MSLTNIAINKEETTVFNELVNPSNVDNEPVNRWFSLKESYSSVLVEKLLNRYGNQPNKVLDPFLGAGTTLFKAWSLGIDGVGFDVNPIAILISKVKTRCYEKNDINKLQNILSEILNLNIKDHDYPGWNPMDKYIDKESLNILLTYRNYIDNIKENKVKNLLKLIWLSIIEEVGYFKKSGNGIKKADANFSSKAIEELFKTKINGVISDINSIIDKDIDYGKINIYENSSMNIDDYHTVDDIDAVITSPPYANCFDYFEVYKVELWMAGFVNSYDEWRNYKKRSMRSNMNAKLEDDDILDNKYFSQIIRIIKDKVEKGEIREKRVPTMLNNYFYDIKILLRKLKPKLNSGATVSIVVGNSAYGGTVIPTDELIASIGTNLGYEVCEVVKARNLRTSPQQMKIMSEKDKKALRESIVTLKLIK